ncbi:MAG: hypothetical protein JKX73_01800 [Flavobacteriales bacterium]|nr:hypothetical protein [Flavobacteriales bacterium]
MRCLLPSLGLICALCLINAQFSVAQHHSFKNYTVEQGLPQNQITVIYQDSKGYLWMGTNGGGVVLYDGQNFLVYSTADGLVNNTVNAIVEDTAGNIWLATYDGLNKYDGKKFHQFESDKALTGTKVWAIMKDSDGVLWFGAYDGRISKYDGVEFTEIYSESKTPIRTIYEDQTGNIWFGTYGKGLGKFDGSGVVFYDEKNGFIGDRVLSILESSDNGVMWFGADGNGACTVKKGDSMKFENINELNNEAVYSIIEDSRGDIWFGSFANGAFRYDGKKYSHYTERDGLASNSIMQIFEDRERNLWFASYGRGLSKLIFNNYTLYNEKNDLPDDFVWSVLEDSEGNICVGTNSGGFAVLPNSRINYNEKKVLQLPLVENVVRQPAFCIHENSKNEYWIGTDHGIEIVEVNYQSGTIKIIRKITTNDGLAGNIVRDIYEDKNGNLWIGTTNGASFYSHSDRMNRKYEFNNLTINDGLVNNWIFSILEDMNGNVWFATDGGVSGYSNNQFRNLTMNEGLVNGDVRTILLGNDGDLWIGTGGGISIYNNEANRFDNITSEDGLSSDRIYLMHFDNMDSNILWIGTNIGLDKFDYGLYRATGEKKFYHLTQLDGFIEEETNTNAIAQDKDGILWIGTVNGLIKFNPKFEKPKNELEPLTHISKIKVMRSDTEMVSGAGLAYNRNYLSFQYIGISLTLSEKVRYKYKLKGLDDEWSAETKETYTSYANLTPGNYSFQVKACNNDGVWNKEPTTFEFNIYPPYWKTWWFYTGELAFFGLLLGATFYFGRSSTKQTRMATILVFISIFVIFEFIQTLLEPYFDDVVGGAPLFKVLINLVIASLLFPAEKLLRAKFRKARK